MNIISFHIKAAKVLSLMFLGVTLVACMDKPKGMVKITTDPGDAEIYINGERKGNSPSEVGQTFAIKLKEGEYTVGARQSINNVYEKYAEKIIYIAEDSLQTVSLTLEKEVSKSFVEHLKQAKQTDPIPKMVYIPAGSFQMGCVSEKSCGNIAMKESSPLHLVNVPAFKMMQHEVTFAQWDACVAHDACKYIPVDAGWWGDLSGRDDRPVMNVSYENIVQEFIPWLNKITGAVYRLPTEAEWEYAARAGSTTKYSWGNSLDCSKANYRNEDCNTRGSSPVKSYDANAFGLYDMHGNVSEWVQDCWNNSYHGAPNDGSAWMSGICDVAIHRGSSFFNSGDIGGLAYRAFNGRGKTGFDRGFRLVQDI